MDTDSETASLVDHNPSLIEYYYSLESRIGYRLMLGGTRHFGYYKPGTLWPFPITRALRAMEEHLYRSLNLPASGTVLDAGCGVGHVAIFLANKGLRIVGIDVIDHHLVKARRNVKAAGLEKQISLRKMDYHYLDGIKADSMDAAFTMETLVHATEPEKALRQFFRVLKPGGTLALYEYDHVPRGSGPKHLEDSMETINVYASMPANVMFDQGVLESMLVRVGFENVKLRDLSRNIEPMLRLFYLVAFIPVILIRLFHLERFFINAIAGYESYRGRHLWRYISVTCTKPGGRGGSKESTAISSAVDNQHS